LTFIRPQALAAVHRPRSRLTRAGGVRAELRERDDWRPCSIDAAVLVGAHGIESAV
jgi:hypothetical protein